jgi:hypothetical protein
MMEVGRQLTRKSDPHRRPHLIQQKKLQDQVPFQILPQVSTRSDEARSNSTWIGRTYELINRSNSIVREIITAAVSNETRTQIIRTD